LLLFFLSLHEGLHEGSVRSRCRHRRRFWSLHSGCCARISFQFFFSSYGILGKRFITWTVNIYTCLHLHMFTFAHLHMFTFKCEISWVHSAPSFIFILRNPKP
jgi:hypothetical protein